MKFTKTTRGGWQFTIEGQTCEAIRNEAGFAHRDWEVWSVKDGVLDKCVEDQMASRAECVLAVTEPRETEDAQEAASIWHNIKV